MRITLISYKTFFGDIVLRILLIQCGSQSTPGRKDLKNVSWVSVKIRVQDVSIKKPSLEWILTKQKLYLEAPMRLLIPGRIVV